MKIQIQPPHIARLILALRTRHIPENSQTVIRLDQNLTLPARSPTLIILPFGALQRDAVTLVMAIAGPSNRQQCYCVMKIHLDKNRRNELVNVLENLRRVPQLIIVDHHLALLAAADTRFQVTLTEGQSHVAEIQEPWVRAHKQITHPNGPIKPPNLPKESAKHWIPDNSNGLRYLENDLVYSRGWSETVQKTEMRESMSHVVWVQWCAHTRNELFSSL